MGKCRLGWILWLIFSLAHLLCPFVIVLLANTGRSSFSTGSFCVAGLTVRKWMVINGTMTPQSRLKMSWIKIMFASRIFSRAEMEHTRLSEPLMQMACLNKLDIILKNVLRFITCWHSSLTVGVHPSRPTLTRRAVVISYYQHRRNPKNSPWNKKQTMSKSLNFIWFIGVITTIIFICSFLK